MKYILVFCLLLSTSKSMATGQSHEFSFMHAKGTEIVDSVGEPVFLRGISFGNRVWVNDRIPTLHHGAEDFERVRDLGMNLVRFYINYQTFESDAKPYTYLDDGWKWLDDNIAWAKANGVYLILNMHVPQGGFQSNGKGWALWEQEALQKRLIALWTAIAKRYQNEPVILGYDLVNEPGVPKNKQEWQTLAQQLVNAIRKVDKQHPIIVERVNSINRRWDNDKDMNFVKVEGENIIYTFHSYDPHFYTHQHFIWDEYMKNREGGVWPDAQAEHTRAFLELTIDNFLAWGKKNNVPLYFGEWGLNKANFEKGRGGLNYIRDMLAVIEARKITNTFHVYHEEAFGLFRGDGKVDPNNVNKPLYDLFLETYTLAKPPTSE